MKKVNIENKFALFSERWSPKVIAQMNNYQFKLVKFQGKFVWHEHADTDETFIVIDGTMQIEFKDNIVTLQQGEMIVIPKGVQHRPSAEKECKAMLVEPGGTVNTGDTGGTLTADNDVWI